MRSRTSSGWSRSRRCSSRSATRCRQCRWPHAVDQRPRARRRPAEVTWQVRGEPQLTNDQAADLVAHILKSNGFPAGKTDFAAADAVNSQIAWPAGAGSAQAARRRRPGMRRTGNLAQLMRGVFFHNSNLIFTIQEVEAKDMPPQPPPSRPDGLTTFDWGLMIYTGWRAVEQSATALADASSLMMLPGLRCENGRAAPVTEPDWIRFTDRMVVGGQADVSAGADQEQGGRLGIHPRSLQRLQRVPSDVSRRRRPRPRRRRRTPPGARLPPSERALHASLTTKITKDARQSKTAKSS